MAHLIPYLAFDGDCREAMKFYESCFGGKLELMGFGDAPPGACQGNAAKVDKNRVMHARLENGKFMLMASDTMPGNKLTRGDNHQINVNCDSIAEIEKLFKAVGAGGKVVVELQDMFWGARFGMVVDKFGTHWMFNCEKK
ncbi:MAG: VOC family protein [Deltaproteobacteria bacterium]|nr:VOC family protein [Deltaproteobacteria bacterium]